jgi:deoxyribodipyrimidine photolyase-like uncharacterized protein
MQRHGKPTRNLVIVLGDQLDPDSTALDDLDPRRGHVWMAEVAEEATHVWSHKARIALFPAAMRHHRDALRGRCLAGDAADAMAWLLSDEAGWVTARCCRSTAASPRCGRR